MNYIFAKNVSKYFSGKPILTKISFSSNAEIVALLGPNGSGKTTLLKILGGLFPPDEGDVYICGHSVKHDYKYVRSIVSIAFPGGWIGLKFYKSVLENLIFYGKVYGLEKTEILSRAKELIELMDLSDFQNKCIAELSDGLRQRTCLAIALMIKTPVLLIDDPTIHLDPLFVLKFCQLVRKECDLNKRCIVIATHNPFIARIIADKILLLKYGRAVYYGNVKDFLSKFKLQTF